MWKYFKIDFIASVYFKGKLLISALGLLHYFNENNFFPALRF